VTNDPRQLQKAILDRRIKRCRKCVSPDRLNGPGVTESAPGFGSLDLPVAIVGEALCRKCIETQEPFVGGSARILKDAFTRAGYKKSDLLITNSIHCHPPGDRDPTNKKLTTALGSCGLSYARLCGGRDWSSVSASSRRTQCSCCINARPAANLTGPFASPGLD
jgi:hypothetical protein